jgi:ubiquitin-protein ligase
MSAFSERRDQDVQKLRDLQKASRDRIRVTRITGQPASEIGVELKVKTAPSKQYPSSIQEVTVLTILLPSKYPFVEPSVTITTPIFHPNVYSSGRICLGMKWLPSFGLDLLVRRIVQIVSFDPAILNEASPANRDALDWYRRARQASPSAFPTDMFSLATEEQAKKMSWNDVTTSPTKAIVSCPSCNARLALPPGKRGEVKCPSCGNVFTATT